MSWHDKVPRAYTKPEMVVSKMLRDMKVRYYSQVTIYTKVRLGRSFKRKGYKALSP